MSKKACITNFKMWPIEIQGSTGSSQPQVIKQHTHSFQVYELPDGQIGGQHEDVQVQVPVLNPLDPDLVQDHSGEDLVAMILDNLLVKETKHLQAAVSRKKQQKRPELCAAINCAFSYSFL